MEVGSGDVIDHHELLLLLVFLHRRCHGDHISKSLERWSACKEIGVNSVPELLANEAGSVVLVDTVPFVGVDPSSFHDLMSSRLASMHFRVHFFLPEPFHLQCACLGDKLGIQ